MRLIGLTTVLALALVSCSKPTSPETSAEDTPASNPQPAATPESKPAERTAAAPSTPALVAKLDKPPVVKAPELAPEGVFYLITLARVETSSGIQSLTPGTGVRRVRPGVYQTPVGELPLDAAQLTNDIGIARSARDAALAEQAAMRAAMATPASRPGGVAGGVKPPAAPDANHLAAVKQMEADKLNREIADLQKRFDALQVQYDSLNSKRAKEDYNRYFKNRVTTSTTDSQITQVKAQMSDVQNRMIAATDRLRTMR